MTGSIEKIIEFAGANLGAGGVIAAAGMLLALPMGLLDSVKERIRGKIRDYIGRLNLSEPVTTEEARKMIRYSLRLLVLDFASILIFIAGVAAAHKLSRGTPWDRGPDFSDFHVMLLCVFAAAYMFHTHRSVRHRKPIVFPPQGSTEEGGKGWTRKKAVTNLIISVATLLLVAVNGYYLPLFFSSYIAGNGALQALFSAGKRKSGESEENAD